MISRIKNWIRERKLRKIAFEDTRIDISLNDFYKYQQDKMLRVYKMSRLEKPESSLEMVQSLRYIDNMTQIVLHCAEDLETLINIVSVTILPGTRMRDSMNLLERSIVLALSGNYTAAYSLLRIAYESLIVGGFYHVIALNPKEMLPDIRKYQGFRQYRYPKPFGIMVEKILENITPEEERFTSFILESRIENILGTHQPKLTPPSFSLMLFQVCEFYRLITPKYKKKIREVYSELSTHIHVMQNTSYDIQNWKEGVVFSTEKLFIFQSFFLLVLDLIGYLYNVIMAASCSFEDVASRTLEYMERFKTEGEKMTLTNLIVESLCKHTLNQNKSEN